MCIDDSKLIKAFDKKLGIKYFDPKSGIIHFIDGGHMKWADKNRIVGVGSVGHYNYDINDWGGDDAETKQLHDILKPHRPGFELSDREFKLKHPEYVEGEGSVFKKSAEVIEEINLSKEEAIELIDKAGCRESALLLKNWDELDEIGEELIKSVRKPAFSSPSTMENAPTSEGAAKKAKYQGSDPRHYDSRGNKTKSGDERSPAYNGSGVTIGASTLREGTKNDEYNRKFTTTRSGKKIRWNK